MKGLEVLLLDLERSSPGVGEKCQGPVPGTALCLEKGRGGSDNCWNPIWATQHITAILPIKHSTSVLVLPAPAVADSILVCGVLGVFMPGLHLEVS